jgi:hypothetical protein
VTAFRDTKRHVKPLIELPIKCSVKVCKRKYLVEVLNDGWIFSLYTL